MRLASQERRTEAEKQGLECGLKWGWVPNNSFPALDPAATLRSSAKEEFMIEDLLFADDSTIIGWTEELREGKEVIKKSILNFEEKCHDGKEEFVTFGTKEADKTRILGTLLGKKDDRAARIKRGFTSCSKVRRWFWKSKLSRRTRSRILQAMVESTMLFDSQARAWAPSDLARLQSMVDKGYGSVWNNGDGRVLKRMEATGTNMYKIREELAVTSVRTKVEGRALKRIGHILRMPNTRITKRVVLGRWMETRRPTGMLRGGLIAYWRRLLRECGQDWTNAGNLAQSRINWKKMPRARRAAMLEWEKAMSTRKRQDPRPERAQTTRHDTLMCSVEGCQRMCKSKSGLVQHERKAHRLTDRPHMCKKCQATFAERAQLANHVKACGNLYQGVETGRFTNLRPRKPCPTCGRLITSNNLAKHERLLHPGM